MPLSLTTFLFVLTAAVTIAYQLAFFAVAATFKIDTVTDFAGGSNFVLLAILTACLGSEAHDGQGGLSLRQWVVTLLVCAWGVRLSGFLLYRICKTSEDKRFDGIRENLWKFAIFWIFQMLWVWIVSLPLTYLNSLAPEAATNAATVADIAGWCLASAGLVLEAVADHEKFSYRQDISACKPDFLATGTWSYSRHPNYLGELMFWWGVFVSCSSVFAAGTQNGEQLGYLTIASPLFITALLLGGSGLSIVERTANRRLGGDASYLAYKRSTPVLLPCPLCYSACPRWFKMAACFEWYDEPPAAAIKSSLLLGDTIV